MEALDAIAAQPAETVILNIFAHGHCYGRTAAAWAFDEMAQRCAARDDLWITTRSAIASHFRAELASASSSLTATLGVTETNHSGQ